MLRLLGAQYSEAELYFIMGGDFRPAICSVEPTAGADYAVPADCDGRPDAKADPHMHDAVLPGLAERVLIIEFADARSVVKWHCSAAAVRAQRPLCCACARLIVYRNE